MQDTGALVNLLADPTRRRILELLAAAPNGATTDEVAAATGVHRTVAATHLKRLVAAGLATAEPTPPGRSPGRPRLRYHSTHAAELAVPPRQHRLLAELMAAALATFGTDGRRAAHAAGIAAGRRLGDSLATTGATYEQREDGTLHVTPCVFREACAADPAHVACEVQAGLIEGALNLACRPLGPTPEGCAYSLDTTTGQSAAPTSQRAGKQSARVIHNASPTGDK